MARCSFSFFFSFSFLGGLVALAACGGSDGADLFEGATAHGTGIGSTAGSDGGGGVGDSSVEPTTSPDSGVAESGLTNDGSPAVDAGVDAGVDASPPLTCVAPKANCSGNPADGCNVDTSTDNANCGGCGVACAGGCSGGVCPLVQVPGGVPPTVGDFACIAVDAINVYVATGRAAPNGFVYKVPTAGGAPSIVASGLAAPHGIASDGTNLYFTTTAAAGQVFRAAVTGGAALPIVSNQLRPVDIVVSNGALFWLDAGDAVTGGSLWKSALDGSGAAALKSSLGIARVGRVRANASMAFWTDNSFGIYAAAINGSGNIVPIAQGANARDLDIDANTVFFSAGPTGVGATTSVLRGPLAGPSAPGTPVAAGLVNARGVATDGSHVYWAEQGAATSAGRIWRANADGSNAVAIATKQNYPSCIAIDKTSVYWINQQGGMVSKTAK